MSDEKEVEYYAAKANAWFNTKLEYDKSLLVLSAGAIGLLITLLTTVGVSSFSLLVVFFASIISFIVCLIAVLAIFSRNAKHLEELISGKKRMTLLGFLDSLSISTFILGVILASFIGLETARNNVILKETIVSDKKGTDLGLGIGSVNGAKNIVSPQGIEKKSFNGAQKIAPPKPNRVPQTHLVIPSQDKINLQTVVVIKNSLGSLLISYPL